MVSLRSDARLLPLVYVGACGGLQACVPEFVILCFRGSERTMQELGGGTITIDSLEFREVEVGLIGLTLALCRGFGSIQILRVSDRLDLAQAPAILRNATT